MISNAEFMALLRSPDGRRRLQQLATDDGMGINTQTKIDKLTILLHKANDLIAEARCNNNSPTVILNWDEAVTGFKQQIKLMAKNNEI